MEYLLPLFSIIMINILLSGDNALVIALASRKLSPKQQKTAMLYGSAGAIVLRIALTFVAVFLCQTPCLQMAGGVLLLWIAIKLIADQKHHEKLEAKQSLWDAVKTIIVADVVMSLDNVIAIAGVAKGKTSLLIIGLMISIPIIIWGSKFIGMFIQKWPIIISIGSVFLGWTAGEMVVTDKQMLQTAELYSWVNWGIPSTFAAIVIVAGRLFASKAKQVGKKK
ncbi:MAG: TerC family protein [Sporomusaceae bacterium]|nr:TerC family protein [Sporomusaceae bacterium]